MYKRNFTKKVKSINFFNTKKNIGSLPRILISSILLITFFYAMPIVTNFANIAIALSIVFLILELNQNRRMMARELVFMEAQAYQGRSELAFDLESLTVENPDLAEMLNRYRAGKAYSEFSPTEQRILKAYYISQL